MSHLFAANLQALAERNSRLATELENHQPCPTIQVEKSKSGFPVPLLEGVAFHSAYYPEKEGEQIDPQIAKQHQVVMFGFGFGYHLERLAMVAGTLTVIEPNLAMLAIAFRERDLTALLSKVTLVTPDNFRKIAPLFDYEQALWLDHEPTVRRHQKERDLLAQPFMVRVESCRHNYSVMVVGPAAGGSVPTARSCATAFKALGFAVDLVENTFYQPSYKRINETTDNKTHKAQLSSLLTSYLGEMVAARIDSTRPDFVVALAQAPLSPEILARLKALDIPLIFWFVENHRVLPYWENVASHYDFFFGMQKDFPQRVIEAGAPFAGYLPQAADPALHKPAQLSHADQEKYGAELSFMGAGYPNRKHFFGRMLDLPLKVWGTEWDLNSALGERVENQNRRMEPEEYVKIFQAGEIHLNLHSSLTASGIDPMADFTNPRTFELAACEAFQLVDNRDELPHFFDIGTELETFATIEELREKIIFYHANPDKRLAIAAAGRARVVREHTFVQRMATMMSHVLPPYEEKKRQRVATASPTKGSNDVDSMRETTQSASLKKFLEAYSDEGELSLKKVMEIIEQGEGSLSRAEALLIIINEIVAQGEDA